MSDRASPAVHSAAMEAVTYALVALAIRPEDGIAREDFLHREARAHIEFMACTRDLKDRIWDRARELIECAAASSVWTAHHRSESITSEKGIYRKRSLTA